MTTEKAATLLMEYQPVLWHQLDVAIKSGINTSWSIAASTTAAWILTFAKASGPTASGHVPWSLLAGGVYDALLTAGEVAHEMPSEEEWARLDERMGRYGERADLIAQLAPVVAEIHAHTDWLRTESELTAEDAS